MSDGDEIPPAQDQVGFRPDIQVGLKKRLLRIEQIEGPLKKEPSVPGDHH